MKIVVVGLVYVGLSNAVLLAQHNEVIGVDISRERVNALRHGAQAQPPQERIFMGDAGAYTLGFLLAACLITLHHRHPEISRWAIWLVIFWLIAGLAHSIVRRWLYGKRPDRPDMMQMHHVVMRTLSVHLHGLITRQIANPLATALIPPLASVPVICGYVLRENKTLCTSFTLAFFVGFFALHVSLVRLSEHRMQTFKSLEV